MLNMDMISQLSDDLLIQILSLVPMKQVIMATCCLSKRWLLLWSLVPELYYDDSSYGDENYAMFTQFVYRSLMSNKAPVLESLYFDLGHKYQAIDVANWIETAVVCHCVKAITVNLRENGTMISLPRSMLYTCETLEALHLIGCFRLDIPFSVCLPSLKNLALGDVDYADNKESSLTRLLSGCPNIETLFLSMYNYSRDQKGSSGFVIDVPSLRGLYIQDDVFYEFHRIEHMPNLKYGHVDMIHGVHNHKFLKAFTCAPSLSLCVSFLEVYTTPRIN